MAAFAYWATAGEPGLNLKDGWFLTAYATNRRGSLDTTIETDPVATAVIALVEHDDFGGTPTAAHEALSRHATEAVRRNRAWPSHIKLRERLRRLQAPLRAIGIEMDLEARAGGKGNQRWISIWREDRAPASRPSSTGIDEDLGGY